MTQKQISASLLQRYIELQATAGYKLDYDWVKNHFRKKCKPSDSGLIAAAIDELVSDKLVEINHDEDITTIMLTATGFETIYKVDAGKATKKIIKEIMTLFSGQKSLPNHVLILTWLQQMLAHTFNPAELALVPAAIARLADMGYITKEEKNNFCIILTQQGYDTIQRSMKLKKAG